MVEITSDRFLTGKSLVRDLCFREEDYVQAGRMRYMSVLRDAFNTLNLKTQFFTKRVALLVKRDGPVPYAEIPPELLDWSSISAPDHCGKLHTIIVNTDIKAGIADLSLVKKCGCSCGCEHELCSYIRNFETIYGTQSALMPDNTTKTFNTTFRKLVMNDGTYIEETTGPAFIYNDNQHTDTVLETNRKVLCKLDTSDCGCVKHTKENLHLIEQHCHASDYRVEFGTAVTDHEFLRRIEHERGRGYNWNEQENRIVFPHDFIAEYIVLRFYVNSKTKDIIVPFIAKEALIAAIKNMTIPFDKKATMNDKLYWERKAKKEKDDMLELLYPILLSHFYGKIFPKKNLDHHAGYRDAHSRLH